MTIRFTQRMIQPTIIGLLILVIIFLRMCSNPKPIPCPPPSVTHTTDTVVIHVNHNIPVPTPGATVYVPVPADVDTQKILKDYFAYRLYDRVLVDDSTGKLVLHDSVTQNKLTKSHLTGKLKQIEHTTTITYNVTIPLKNRIFIGAQIGTDLNSFALMPKITLLPKSDRTLYSISYDPFNKYYYIGMDFKIHLGK